jgi:hypothetical protein
MNVLSKIRLLHALLPKAAVMVPQPWICVDAGDLTIVLHFGLWREKSALRTRNESVLKLTPAGRLSAKARIR